MRCPTLSRRLSIVGERGLSNCSRETRRTWKSGLLQICRIWQSYLQDQPLRIQLSYLAPATMKELIDKWSKAYDFVIIDSPSLLAVTDAAVLSKMADMTLLITRHAQSTRKSLERAWQTLRIDPETKVGVVLNAVRRESAAYGEYFGYYGNSYYGKRKGGAHA
jgi:hypothetical protein